MDLPNKKYSVIYADPPWNYLQKGAAGKKQGYAAQHYKTMTTDDICALPVQQLAGGGCLLFMWATFPTLPDALLVMDAWGFAYKTAAFVWVKKYKCGKNFVGMGAYTRANAEICLLGVSHDFCAKKQIKSHSVRQVIEEPIQAHSVKPEETRRRIVDLLGDVPRIELFARQRVPGWDAWGDEIEEKEDENDPKVDA